MMAQLAFSSFLSRYSGRAHVERHNFDINLLFLPTRRIFFAYDDCNYGVEG